MKTKTINVWVCINKDGFINTFASQPTRNKKTGKWESNSPFINSVFYKDVQEMIKQTHMSWESEPEFFEINID